MSMRKYEGFGCAGTQRLSKLLIFCVMIKLYYVTNQFSRIIALSSVQLFMPQIIRLIGERFGVICNCLLPEWVLSLGF